MEGVKSRDSRSKSALKGNLRCTFCSKTFGKNFHLEMHMRAHTKEKPFKCERCDFVTALTSTLREHQKVHDPSLKNLKYKCDYCAYRAPSTDKLQRHSAVHTGEKPFACPVPDCNYRSAAKENLKRHSYVHKGAEEREEAQVHKCKVCSYQTNCKESLKKHGKTHQDQKPFACDVTGCKFRSKWAQEVTSHRKSHFPHLKSNQLACPRGGCEFVTVHAASLRMHLRVHNGERPYKCESCDYSARTRSYLAMHVRNKHEPGRVKTVSCPLCPKLFFTVANMKSHTHTHTHEKAFKCHHKNCTFATSYKMQLKIHVQKMHMDK